MEQYFTRIIESLIFPPGLFLFWFAVALLLLNKRPSLAKLILWVGMIGFYLLSTPLVSELLISRVETYPALDAENLQGSAAGAIVVLASGRNKNAREYGGDTVGKDTLTRVRYGAFLQRKTGLPILVSGGLVLDQEGESLAQVMTDVLLEDFQAGEVWLEDKSRTTGENAFFSKKLLAQKGIDTVYLVTQAWHMPRSAAIFEKAGLNVIPAPTAFEGEKPFNILSVLPGAGAIRTSYIALHEMVGAIWYRFRHSS